MKVFGIGFPKTGTTTLADCLKRLGFNHFGWNREFATEVLRGDKDRALRVAEQHDSFDDMPWPDLYKLMDESHPEAKFVLTTRKDAATWFESQKRHTQILGPTETGRLFYGYALLGNHRDALVAQYERHNREVVEYFKDRPDKLLVLCWEQEPSWDKLCAFLGKTVPDAPFPHRNPIKLTLARRLRRYLRCLENAYKR